MDRYKKNTFQVPKPLNENLQSQLDSFLTVQSRNSAAATLNRIKRDCLKFLLFMQDKGITSVSEISYSLMRDYYTAEECDKGWKAYLFSSAVSMLAFHYQSGNVRYGMTIYYHYLATNGEPAWLDVGPEDAARIHDIMSDNETEPVERIADCRSYLDSLYRQNDYSKSSRTQIDRHTDLLYLFLDYNHYRYHPEIAKIWYKSKETALHCPYRKSHRSICLIEQYISGGSADVDAFFKTDPRAFDQLPDWCWKATHEYESVKLQEGWETSTMDMIRSSITRFCNSLDQQGVHSFSDLAANHIKTFNLNDKHKTSAGKNAYNTRIRKFLIFLGERGYLSNPMLFTALPRENAPNETIVVVLTDDEMAQLNNCFQEDTRVSLRKKAMVLLGLKMGLRESDIVNLKYNNIDWNAQSIRFIQKKTQVEVNLPMPTVVGNALFRYITQERHQKDTPYIFLSENAPYTSVNRSACNRALDTALPDRDVYGSGFHVTRKTFATEKLKSGVGADVVAEALGQRSTASVHRYLSLDEGRMKLCALSLEKNGIGGWKNGQNN